MKKACRTREDPFEEPHLAEGETQFSSDERKEEVDGVCKAIVKEMEGAEGE